MSVTACTISSATERGKELNLRSSFCKEELWLRAWIRAVAPEVIIIIASLTSEVKSCVSELQPRL
jgi:hypothetical protein